MILIPVLLPPAGGCHQPSRRARVVRSLKPAALGLLLLAAGCQAVPVDESEEAVDESEEAVAASEPLEAASLEADGGLRSAAAPLVPVAEAGRGDEQGDEILPPQTDGPASLDGVNLEELLSMTYTEASLMSAASVELGRKYRVAAEEIDVLERDRAGNPSKVIARGRVFVEMQLDQVVVALADNAEVGPRELVLRGRPVIGRGFSVLAGTEDDTVFVLAGDALRVSGGHQAMQRNSVPVRREQLMAGLGSAGSGGGGGGGGGGEPARSYRIDQDFELPPLPDVTEEPDPILLGPLPDLPEIP